MKIDARLFLLVLVFTLGCSQAKTDQVSETDSLTSSAPDSLPPTELKPIEPTDTTIHTLTLQWQDVSMSEYGPAYQFIDNKGNPHSFSIMNIPGFDFQNNEYFEAKYEEGSMFPTIKMSSQTIGTWYTVTIKNEYREENGVGGAYSVITAIVPVGN